MALLHEIQTALMDDKVGVGSTLLKLRFLASKLGSDILEAWVKHETEGYPSDAEVPDYRVVGIIYSGTFQNMAYQYNDVSIPSYLIEKFANASWVSHQLRDSLSVIDATIARADKNTRFALDTGNLKLLLQGKIYEGMGIVDITGSFDVTAFVRVQQAVRAKVLDLTIELEKSVPTAAEITVGKAFSVVTAEEKEQVTHLTQQVFYGDVTNINSSGGGAHFTLNVAVGSAADLISALSAKGIPEPQAKELAAIAAAETPESADQPYGKKVAAWLADKGKKGLLEAWGIGKEIGTQFAKEALMQYYGLK